MVRSPSILLALTVLLAGAFIQAPIVAQQAPSNGAGNNARSVKPNAPADPPVLPDAPPVNPKPPATPVESAAQPEAEPRRIEYDLPPDSGLPGTFQIADEPKDGAEPQWRETPRGKIKAGVLAFTADGQRFRDEHVATLTALTALFRLSLFGCHDLSDGAIGGLAAIKGLRELDLSVCTRVTDAGFQKLGALKQLHSLVMKHSCRLYDGGLKAICTLTNLEVLHIGVAPNLTDEGFTKLAALKRLRYLTIEALGRGHDDAVSDASIAAISQLTQLEELHLLTLKSWDRRRELPGIGPKGLSALQALIKLRALTLGYGGLWTFQDDMSGLAFLASFDGIERLQADIGPLPRSAVLKHLPKAHLKHLELKNLSGASEEDAAELAKCTGLEILTLEQYWFDEADAARIATLPALRELVCVCNGAIAPNAVLCLAKAPKLERLGLKTSPSVRGDVILAITQIENLRELDLRRSWVRDEDLLYLVLLKRLERLDLRTCPGITDGGIASFKKLRPECEVVR